MEYPGHEIETILKNYLGGPELHGTDAWFLVLNKIRDLWKEQTVATELVREHSDQNLVKCG